MAVETNNADAGVNGAAVSTGDTGSGDPWDVVSAGSGTITYDSGNAYKGSNGIAITSGTAADRCYLGWEPAAAPTKQATRFYFKFATLPTSAYEMFRISNTALSAPRLSIVVSSSGYLRIGNYVGAYINAFGGASTSTTAISAGTWYRLELGVDVSGGASAGIVNMDVYTGDSTSAISGLSGAATGQSFTTTLPLTIFGRTGSLTDHPIMYLDDLAISTGTTTYLGPSPTPSTAATAAATAAGRSPTLRLLVNAQAA